STVGNYTVQVTLNAALDAAAYLAGTSNGTLATAQPIDGSFQSLSPLSEATRGAVLGSNAASATPRDNYFSVNLSAGDVITAGLENLSGSGTAISLWSPAGVDLANGAAGPTNLSQAISGFSIPATGRYYLLVTGEAAAAYDVVVTRNAAFSLLPHSTSATAQNISSPGVVLGDLSATTGTSSSIVVPNANANIDGDGNNAFPFNLANYGAPSMRYQQIYSATQFASGGVINALRFRPEDGTSPFSTSG